MNPEERSETVILIEVYSNIFHIEGNKWNFSKVQYDIKTFGEIPVHPTFLRKGVQQEVQSMLNRNIIRSYIL